MAAGRRAGDGGGGEEDEAGAVAVADAGEEDDDEEGSARGALVARAMASESGRPAVEQVGQHHPAPSASASSCDSPTQAGWKSSPQAWHRTSIPPPATAGSRHWQTSGPSHPLVSPCRLGLPGRCGGGGRGRKELGVPAGRRCLPGRWESGPPCSRSRTLTSTSAARCTGSWPTCSGGDGAAAQGDAARGGGSLWAPKKPAALTLAGTPDAARGPRAAAVARSPPPPSGRGGAEEAPLSRAWALRSGCPSRLVSCSTAACSSLYTLPEDSSGAGADVDLPWWRSRFVSNAIIKLGPLSTWVPPSARTYLAPR